MARSATVALKPIAAAACGLGVLIVAFALEAAQGSAAQAASVSCSHPIARPTVDRTVNDSLDFRCGGSDDVLRLSTTIADSESGRGSAPGRSSAAYPLPHVQTTYVDQWGAAGDHLKDDKPAFQLAAEKAASTGGGIVKLDCSKAYYVSNIVLPAGVSIEGCLPKPDRIGGTSQELFGSRGSAIALSSTEVHGVGRSVRGSTTVDLNSLSDVPVVGMSVEGSAFPGGTYLTAIDGPRGWVSAPSSYTTGDHVTSCAITTTAGSLYTTLSGCVAQTAGIAVGARISAPSVPPDTAVVGIDAANNVILSVAPKVTATNVAAVFANPSSFPIVLRNTITLGPNAGVRNLLVYRAGMTFPAKDASRYAGEAFRVGYQSDGAYIENVIAIGFRDIFQSRGVSKYTFANSRIRISDLYFDGVNGIRISGSGDVNRINNIHGWPFGTIANTDGGPLNNDRPGTCLLLEGQNDGTQGSGWLCSGYKTNFDIESSAVQIGTLWSDYNGRAAGTVGLRTGPNTTRISIADAQLWGTEQGIVRSANATETMHVGTLSCTAITANCISLRGGDLFVDYVTADGEKLASIAQTSSHLFIRSGVFAGKTAGPVVLEARGVDPAHVKISVDFPSLSAGASVYAGYPMGHCLQSAARVFLLPVDCEEIDVVGSGSIVELSGGWGNRHVRLFFTSPTSVLIGGNLRLSGDANYSARKGAFLDVTYDSEIGMWRENSRGN